MAYRYLAQFKYVLVLALAAMFGAHAAAAQTAVSFPVYYNGVSIGTLSATMTSTGPNSCGPGRAYYESFYTFSGWTLSGGGYSGGGTVPSTEGTDFTESSGGGTCPAVGWSPALPYTLPFTSRGYLTYTAPGGTPVQQTVTDYEVVFFGTIAYLTKCSSSCS